MPLCPPCSIIPKNLCLLPKLQGAYDTSFSLHTTALSFRTYFHFWDVYSHCLNLSKYEAEGKHSFTESMRSVKYKVTILTLSFTEDNSLHRIFALIWYLSAYFLICKNQVTTSTRKLFQDTIANKNIKNWYSVYTIRKLSLSKGFTHTHPPNSCLSQRFSYTHALALLIYSSSLCMHFKQNVPKSIPPFALASILYWLEKVETIQILEYFIWWALLFSLE